MKIRNISTTLLLCLTATLAYCQVEISEDTQQPDTTKVKKSVKKKKKNSTTEFFVISNWSYTDRKLIENPNNGGLFADPLGERANEGNLNSWSFGIGIKDRIKDYLTWEGGVSYLRNGESYSFEGSDTLHTYTTTYSYISMPVKVYYTYGDNIRLYAGGGLIPQMFLKYKQDRVWINSVDTETKETFTTQNGYNSFVLSAVANVGVQLNLGKNVSILFMPEFRMQLTSSYESQASYKHYGRAFGFNMGLTYIL